MDVKTSHKTGDTRITFQQTLISNYCKGLTLIELVTILAITSITLMIGAPALAGVVNSNRVATELNHLSATLRYAWSEAITTNQIVVACPSSDGKTCLKTKQWEKGWLIYVDKNDDRKLDADDEIKRVFEAMPKGFSVTYNAFGPPRRYIPFYPTDGMRTDGTYSFCIKGFPELSRALIVSKARPRVSKTLRTGKPVKCAS